MLLPWLLFPSGLFVAILPPPGQCQLQFLQLQVQLLPPVFIECPTLLRVTGSLCQLIIQPRQRGKRCELRRP